MYVMVLEENPVDRMMVFKMKPFDYLDSEESIIFNEIKKMMNECV